MPLGRFRSAEARDAFLEAYDRAMAAWPVTPTQGLVETRYGETYVHTLGAPQGTPLVLLHAIAVSSPSWFRSIGALAEGHPVYALDTIGDAGRSIQTAPLDDGADMAMWLDEALAGLDLPRVHLVGLSYGGWLALNQAQRSPTRLASVTVVDPPGALGPGRVLPMLTIVPDALLAKFAKSDAALRRLLARLNDGEPPPQPLLDLSIAGLRTFESRQPRPKKLDEAQLRSITTPTLLLLCARSPVTNPRRAAERARRLMPNADVEIVTDAGHMLPVEHSVEFTNRLLAFVDGVDEVVS